MTKEQGRELDKIIRKLTILVTRGESAEIRLVIDKGLIVEAETQKKEH
ncbi:MAG: hypothetical protein WC332_00430 [Clostridia bacterium]|jgi:hypothetical protein